MTFTSTHNETQQELRVISRREVATDTYELEFSDVTGAPLPTWEPGAHIDLKLSNGMSRQYSLMEGLEDKNNWRIAVLVEREGRGGSLLIEKELVLGSEISSIGPRNHFPLSPAGEYLFVAGGIGITPLLKMLEHAEVAGTPWKLAYLGRSPESMAYGKDLKSKYGSRVESFAKSDGNRFDVDAAVANLAPNAHIYSCGPERLMVALEDAMANVDMNRVHVERFHPRDLVLNEPDQEFVVYCAKSDEEITVPADESILMAADFAGIDIPGDCMEGTCGACETRVIEGDVDHRDSVLSAQARSEGDTMMICVSRGKGRLVLDL